MFVTDSISEANLADIVAPAPVIHRHLIIAQRYCSPPLGHYAMAAALWDGAKYSFYVTLESQEPEWGIGAHPMALGM